MSVRHVCLLESQLGKCTAEGFHLKLLAAPGSDQAMHCRGPAPDAVC